MQRRRQSSSRRRLAIEQWLPFDSRQLALIVLAAICVTGLTMFVQW